MEGTKYLSELIDIASFRRDRLNLIVTPTGSGKTHFALETLYSHLPQGKNMLFLIDTSAGCEAVLYHDHTTSFNTYMFKKVFCRTWGDDETITCGTCIAMTYAKFGVVLKETPQFLHNFAFIVCDELHNLIKYQSFDKKSPQDQEENRLKQVENYLKKLILSPETDNPTVIGMTATPSLVERAFEGYMIHSVSIDKNAVRRYTTTQTISTRNILISSKQESGKGIVFTSRITKLQEMQKELEVCGKRCVALWSPHNEKYPLSDEQYRVRTELLKTGNFPEEYDVLLINSSMETGINIYGDIGYMAIDSFDADTIKQVRGRLREDLPRLYLSNRMAKLVIPEEYLNRRLYKMDKDKLCTELNFRSEKGRLLKWKTAHARILEEDSAYTSTEGRDEKGRYTIIRLKDGGKSN